MSWAPLAGLTVVVAVMAAARRPWDGHELTLEAARVTAALVAAGVAFTLDDAAAVTLAPSPTSLLCRRSVRLLLGAAAAAAVTGGTLLAVGTAGGAGALPMARFVLEAAGLLLLAMALSVGMGADRGVFVFTGALLAAVVVQHRWPEWSLFPPGAGAPGWERAGAAWGVAAVAAAVALVLLSRER